MKHIKKFNESTETQNPLFQKMATKLTEDWEIYFWNGKMGMQYKHLSMGHDKMAVSGWIDARGEMEIWEEDDMGEIQYFFRGKVTESTIDTILKAIDIYQYVDRFKEMHENKKRSLGIDGDRKLDIISGINRSRGEVIELLSNTSNFDIKSLRRMTNLELSDLWRSLEMDEWLKEKEK